MNAYRFSIPAEVMFTIEAETEAEARDIAIEGYHEFYEGCDLDVNTDDGDFAKAGDVRIYTDANKADPKNPSLEYVEEIEQ